jgi:hypothetical protein
MQRVPKDLQCSRGYVAAQASYWHAVDETFGETREEAQEKLEKRYTLLRSVVPEDQVSRVEQELKEHDIFEAVRVANAEQYGLPQKVFTRPNWEKVREAKGWV